MTQDGIAAVALPPSKSIDDRQQPGKKSGLPTVDVVVPCYNYARFLPGCVHSVLAQPGVDARVLIIDDASPDNTEEVGQELAARYSSVEFRRHKNNKGHIATYNEGLLEWSTGDYVVLLSADDMLAPGSLERATSVMEADQRVGMVYGRTIHFQNEKTLPTSVPRRSSHDYFPGSKWLSDRCRAGHNVITSPEVVVRSSIQKIVGGYRPELPHSGDLEMWMRIAAVSDIAFVRNVQAYYRVHSSSMQRTQFKTSFADLVHRKAAFDLFFRHHPAISDSAEWSEMASRALAREALWDICRAYDHNRVDAAQEEALMQFVLAAYPKAHTLSEYKALQRRKRLGPAVCNRTQIFLGPALVRRAIQEVKKDRMKRRGI
ncbi:MAG TPA: glycosyltransferase [Alloacidobacterium sp.]|jgi:glycosyltransferase involved in cell wall biosynthesis|nr:glycosyltransferase [Alloacidobacterium sp.]